MNTIARRLYPAVIEKEGGAYGVVFPDLPGCVTVGHTFEHAFLNAHEALAGHVDVTLEHGESLPEPSPVADIASDPEHRSGVVMLVGVTVPSTSRQIEIEIDDALLRDIDRLSDNRSEFLTDAARVELARRMAG